MGALRAYSAKPKIKSKLDHRFEPISIRFTGREALNNRTERYGVAPSSKDGATPYRFARLILRNTIEIKAGKCPVKSYGTRHTECREGRDK